MNVIIQTVFPLFGIILLGYLIGRFKILGTQSAKVLNTFVMKIPLPILVFGAIASEPIQTVWNGPFILAFLLALLIPYGVAFAISRLKKSEPTARSALRALAYSFPNTGYMGIPLLGALFQKEGILMASIATFLTVFIILLTIILCEFDKQEDKTFRSLVRETGLLCLKNPLMIATVLGVLYSLIALPMAKPFQTFIDLLGNVAGPCALFALGQLLVGRKLTKGLLEIGSISLVKLVLQPALALFFFWAFHVEMEWAVGGFLLAALPTGVILAVLVDYYQTYLGKGLAAILITTVISLGTLMIVLPLMGDIFGFNLRS